MLKLLTLLAFSGLLSTSLLAKECQIKGLRVEHRFESEWKGEKETLYTVGNLEQSFPISDRASKDLKQHMERSYQDHQYSFDMNFSELGCSVIERMQKSSIKSVVPSSFFTSVSNHNFTQDHDCIECLNLSNAPVIFDFPSMKDISEVLNHAIGLNEKETREFQNNLYQDFQTMDFKTPQANTIILLTNLVERLAEFGLKRIDHFQIEYLIQLMKPSLPEEEWSFMNNIVTQIDVIDFEKDGTGKTTAQLSLTHDKIIIGPEDIPTRNKRDRDILKNYLDSIVIHDNTRVEVQKQNHKKRDVKLRGVEVNGLIPIIGRVGLYPRYFTLSPNDKTPVQAEVRIKKGISFSKTFDVDL